MNNTVFLIEDEEKTGDMLSQALESEDIGVVWAKDGESALKKMEKGKFDLVILDLKLPGLSGEDVLAGIRKVDPYIEVVVYTNYEESSVMKKLINLGVDRYIKKGAEADLWKTVAIIKAKLDPLSPSGTDSILEALPEEMFTENDVDRDR